MDESLVQKLIEYKLRYFGSKFFSVENWLMFNNINLPKGITTKDLEDWEPEKQQYLAMQRAALDGVAASYERIIIDRLDAAAALQEQIVRMLKEVSNTKDASNIAITMERVAQLQDEAMKILKVDAYRSNLYDKNKTATENLLQENKIILE